MHDFDSPYFEGHVEHIDLESGGVELNGITRSGKAFTLSGDVEEVKIVVESEYPPYSRNVVSEKKEYWLKFKIKEDTTTGSYAYKVQLDTIDIERTARILADDRTAAAIEAARVRCGAPENAKFDFGFHPRGDVASLEATILEPRQPIPVMVHFYWTEQVVK